MENRLQSGIFENLLWLLMIIIFVAVCVGVARDLSKVKRETRQRRSRTRTVPRQLQPTKEATQQPP